jgi:hypothetical protein
VLVVLVAGLGGFGVMVRVVLRPLGVTPAGNIVVAGDLEAIGGRPSLLPGLAVAPVRRSLHRDRNRAVVNFSILTGSGRLARSSE